MKQYYVIGNTIDSGVIGIVDGPEEAERFVIMLNDNNAKQPWYYTPVSTITLKQIEAIREEQQVDYEAFLKELDQPIEGDYFDDNAPNGE